LQDRDPVHTSGGTAIRLRSTAIIRIITSGRAVRIAAAAAALSIALPFTPFPPAGGVAEAAQITKADFFKPGLAPVRSKGAYDVTVVYFMDYQCPVCRARTDDYERVFKEDPKVRVIYRDTPFFGPQSEAAARLAIASQFQGKHEAFHLALMRTRGRLSDAAIRQAAANARVDWARLQKDLAARKGQIDAQIEMNTRLSEAAGISGTPAFIIGDTLADGAFDYANLKGQIADVRAASRKGR
jgi:protein-disulfide isomerase